MIRLRKSRGGNDGDELRLVMKFWNSVVGGIPEKEGMKSQEVSKRWQ